MNPMTALRAARPHDAAPRRGTDARAEQDLHALLGADYRPPRDRAVRGPRATIALNAGIAAVLLAAGTGLVLALGVMHPEPATSVPATQSPPSANSPRLLIVPLDLRDSIPEPHFTGTHLKVAVASNGCITIGGSFLMAPRGSSLIGQTVHLQGIGDTSIGSTLESVSGQPVSWPGHATDSLRGTLTCGPGSYLLPLSATSLPTGGTSSSPASTLTAHSGCSPTSTTLPAHAVVATIGDVDGDHRADREWAANTETGLAIGVQTASGAVLSTTIDFAGGGTRSAFVAPLAHSVVAVASEERSAELFSFQNCRFTQIDKTSTGRFFALIDTPVEGPGATPYVGAGTSCSDGQLFAVRDDSSQSGQGTASITRTPLTLTRAAGTVMLGQPTTTQHPSTAAASAADDLSCGTTPVLTPDQ